MAQRDDVKPRLDQVSSCSDLDISGRNRRLPSLYLDDGPRIRQPLDMEYRDRLACSREPASSGGPCPQVQQLSSSPPRLRSRLVRTSLGQSQDPDSRVPALAVHQAGEGLHLCNPTSSFLGPVSGSRDQDVGDLTPSIPGRASGLMPYTSAASGGRLQNCMGIFGGLPSSNEVFRAQRRCTQSSSSGGHP